MTLCVNQNWAFGITVEGAVFYNAPAPGQQPNDNQDINETCLRALDLKHVSWGIMLLILPEETSPNVTE